MKEEAGKPVRSGSEGNNPPYRVNFAGRPFITFNSGSVITDCSREVADILKLTKEEILASNPIANPLNAAFKKAIDETLASGICYFSGRLIIGDRALPPGYSFVMIPLETLMHESVGIICFMLPEKATLGLPVPGEAEKPEAKQILSDKRPPAQPDLFNENTDALPGKLSKTGLDISKYKQLLMSLPTGIALLTKEGIIFEINSVMAGIMNHKTEDFDKTYNIHESKFMMHLGVAHEFDACVAEKVPMHGEMHHQFETSGQPIFLQYSFVPIPDEDGDIELVVLSVRDSSVLKQLESESRQRVDFLNLVINTMRMPFFLKDEQHRWVMLNDAAIEMMGRSREELIGKSDYDIFPKEQADEFWAKDELVFREGFNINEEQITWFDGSIHTIITSKQLHVEKQGGRKFIVGTNMDITDIRKKEAELVASESKYRYLFDNANDFIITIDLEGNITNANERFLKAMGVSLEETCKLNISHFIRPEDKEKFLRVSAEIIAGKHPGFVEFEAYDLEHKLRTYDSRVSVIKVAGVPTGVQCIFDDITEKKKAQIQLEEYSQELQNLNATKDKFFSIIAHDLRNPYSSLIGFAELMLEDLDKLTLDEMREYLRIIRNSAKNSLNLLENLLAWSRLQTNRMTFDPQKINLYNAVEEVVEVLNSLAYRKKIDISVLVEPKIEVEADKNMLTTILHNLVMNAIKYTPIGGNIYISNSAPEFNVEKSKSFVNVSVADTGVGIEEKLQEKLFSSEKPESKPGTDKEQGTGLGLVLSQEMVERHGGSIWVKSNPGEGSVFTFMIPVIPQIEKKQ